MAIHAHYHSIKVVSSGDTLDGAVTHALKGLTDPQGHHSKLKFRNFEVTRIGGSFGSDGRPVIEVTVEASGEHRS